MMPVSKRGDQFSGRINPTYVDDVEQETNSTCLNLPNNIVQPNGHIVVENVIRQSRENNQNQQQNRPRAPKLKAFEIYKFADKWDIFLMVFGTLFALATGSALPLAMWLFESVLNSLLELGKGNSTSTISPNCYRSLLSTNDPHLTITSIIPWYAVIGAASIVLHWLAYSFWMITCERQLRRIRYALFKNILKQEIDWFDRRKAGELTSHLVESLENIRERMGFRVADFICLLSRIISSIVFSLYVGWKLTLVFLSVSPLVVLAFTLIIYVTPKYAQKEYIAYAKASSIVQEVLGAIRTVTTFSGQETETKRYKNNLTEGRRIGIHRGILLGLIQGFLYVVLYGATALIFWYGPHLIRSECQNYSPGGWIVIFSSCLASILSFVYIIPNVQSFIVASASAEHVFEIINRQSEIDPFIVDGNIPEGFQGDIEFRNVSFKYPSRESAPILHDLTMRIKSGQTVALCGPSGSGKSTIIQLLQRFYDPAQGEILLDGNRLRTLNVKQLRSNIGVVSQEPVLFFGSIEDNIRLGKPNATDEEVQNAARMANAHDFIIALSRGYMTIADDKLSGGEKQRIVIARALISNPKILLLDEPTSALDNQSEKDFQDALDKAKQGRTTIVVAHRLSTIKNVDIIFELENGKIMGFGTHNELMARKGLYYKLVLAESEQESAQQAARMQVHINQDNRIGEANQSKDDLTQQTSRLLTPYMQRQFSRTSVTSATSDADSDTGSNVQMTDEIKDASRCRTPFIFKILKLNSPEWYYLLLGGIASLVFGGVMPSFSLIFSHVYGALMEDSPDKQADEIRTYTYSIFLIGVAGAICQIMSHITLAKAAEELTLRVRVMSFESILRQEIGWFDLSENNSGILVTRLSSDAVALKGFTAPTFRSICNAIGALIAGLVISFEAGWKLTLVVLCFAPFMVLNGAIQNQHFSKPEKKAATSDAEEAGKHAAQAIDKIRSVASLCLEKAFIAKYERAFDEDFRYRMKHLHLVAASNSIANSAMYFIYAACFGYGVTLLKSREMIFQNVFRVFAVITYTSIAVGRSVADVPNYSKGKESVERILQLNKRQSKINPYGGFGKKISDLKGNIEFRNIRFCYPTRSRDDVLRHFNLKFDANQTTALVGPSGNGKSTIVALIQRFYDPLDGEVLLDGLNIKTLDVKWLRSLFGVVQQESTLFNISISANIAYGDNSREVTQDEIEAAAKRANIHDRIMQFPDGYNTLCGIKGSKLAGGERQRIAIARALIRHPKILLLDEAVSALDNENVRLIQVALEQAQAGQTCITIAHRLPTIQNSDKICVVAAKKIREMGRHEQLIEQHGIYFNLWKAQQRSDNN